jgi:hypothetical protein
VSDSGHLLVFKVIFAILRNGCLRAKLDHSQFPAQKSFVLFESAIQTMPFKLMDSDPERREKIQITEPLGFAPERWLRDRGGRVEY